jgi:hypothetical protein
MESSNIIDQLLKSNPEEPKISNLESTSDDELDNNDNTIGNKIL